MDAKPDLCVSACANDLADPIIAPDLIFVSVLKYEVIRLNEYVLDPSGNFLTILSLFLVLVRFNGFIIFRSKDNLFLICNIILGFFLINSFNWVIHVRIEY